MMKLSRRLKTVASLISEGYTLADVGTDHGYVPIYLIEQKKIPRAIAMDIGVGPLERAKEHIRQYGMGAYIQTRLSDGVGALQPKEADSILIAGMGGGLVLHILEAGKHVCQIARELVLQPQSELARVRVYLRENGYVTMAEEMVEEEGKYYPMMRVCYQPEQMVKNDGQMEEYLFDLYGRYLLLERHPVLLEYLKKERKIYLGIRDRLISQIDSIKTEKRLVEVETVLESNKAALAYY